MSPKTSDLELACVFADGGMLGEVGGREEVIKVRWTPSKKDCRPQAQCIILMDMSSVINCSETVSFKSLIILRNTLLNCQIYCPHVAF